MHLPLSRPRPRTRRAIFAAALVGAALVPATAQAGTASLSTAVSGGLITYDAKAGEANSVSVFVQDDKVVIADSAPVTASSSCTLNRFGDAECPVNARLIHVQLGDKNDTIVYRAPHQASVTTDFGDDVILGGLRQTDTGRSVQAVSYFGSAGRDTLSYAAADRGVRVDTDDNVGGGPAEDGRPGIDFESVGRDIEKLEGSNFADVLFGSPGNDNITGRAGDDELGGGAGNDFFFEGEGGPSGADSIHGADGDDRVSYAGRTNGVNVSLDNNRNDGEPGERDDVRSNVENITAGNGGDILTGSSVANDLQGFGGIDTLHGLGGNDTLQLGSKSDFAFGGIGNDVILAGDGEPDTINCGEDSDTANRDSVEKLAAGCEKGTVGKLGLAGKGQQLELSWTHPRDWRQLRRIELRLSDDGVPVGEIVIRPKGERIEADGAVELVRSRLSRKGKKVAAKLAVRFDGGVAGRLDAEVEAVDRRGLRQVELSRIKLGG
jgi:Ca2+-binding RTX toxin-like protein